MATGASGFMTGLMQGMPYGAMLGDRIANVRANNRMQDLQDQISAGAFDPANFGGDSAKAQQALQDATRQAQEPLAARGLAPQDRAGGQDYAGSDQYSAIMRQQQLRADQRAGAMANSGDVPGALRTSAMSQGALGDLKGQMQTNLYADQVQAGQAAIKPGDNGQPMVDQEALAGGTSAALAKAGDAAGASQWGHQQIGERNNSVQNLIGRAITVGTNPALGGLEAAAGPMHAAAKLMGYPDVQYSKQQDALQVLDQSGNVAATVKVNPTPAEQQQGVVSLMQVAQTMSTDPSQVMGMIRGSQAQQYADQRADSSATRGKLLDAAIKNTQEFSDAGLNVTQLEKAALGLTTSASKAGWNIEAATGQDTGDGTTGGKRYIAYPPGGGPPVVLTMNPPDPNDPTSPGYTITGMNGQQLTEAQVAAMGPAGSGQVALQAVQAQANLDNARLNQQRYQMRQSRLQDVGRAFMPGGGAMTMPGAVPQASAGNYQSQYPGIAAAMEQQESGGQQGAISSKGARGVTQLMPDTARELEQKYGFPQGSSDSDPAINRELGQRFLDENINKYSQSVGNPQAGMVLGLMAYNWGPGNVDRWLAAGAPKDAVPAETQNYVQRILNPKASKGTTASATMPATRTAPLPRVAPTAPVNTSRPLPAGASGMFLYNKG